MHLRLAPTSQWLRKTAEGGTRRESCSGFQVNFHKEQRLPGRVRVFQKYFLTMMTIGSDADVITALHALQQDQA